jgi:glycosyltransferase involved in cell wall biosynthesis
MVLLEAGACGVPVVATDVPGSREVVVDGETGWLAPAGDAEELAKTMMTLMHLPPDTYQCLISVQLSVFVSNRYLLYSFSPKSACRPPSLMENFPAQARSGTIEVP